jgi:hypothetical protein
VNAKWFLLIHLHDLSIKLKQYAQVFGMISFKIGNTVFTAKRVTCVLFTVICAVRLLFVLFYVLFVCKCVLPPGDNPIAVNKYIISYIKEEIAFK